MTNVNLLSATANFTTTALQSNYGVSQPVTTASITTQTAVTTTVQATDTTPPAPVNPNPQPLAESEKPVSSGNYNALANANSPTIRGSSVNIQA